MKSRVKCRHLRRDDLGSCKCELKWPTRFCLHLILKGQRSKPVPTSLPHGPISLLNKTLTQYSTTLSRKCLKCTHLRGDDLVIDITNQTFFTYFSRVKGQNLPPHPFRTVLKCLHNIPYQIITTCISLHSSQPSRKLY